MRQGLSAAAAIVLTIATAACKSGSTLALWAASPFVQTTEACEDQPSHVAPLATDRRIRMASWNMLYLGPSEKTPVEKRDPRELADYVRRSGASVLALQEIGVQMDDGRLSSPTLDALFDALRKRGAGDWTYLLYGHPERDANQFVGLAWNQLVLTLVDKPMPLELTGDAPGIVPFIPLPFGSDVWPRKPFAVKLSAGPGATDVVFVPVHLTARVETWFFEDATAHRAVEAGVLAKELDRIKAHFEDDDLVILGDFNIELASEDVNETLVKRGLRDLNCANLATYEHGLALDHFYVPSEQPEFGLDPNFARVVPTGVRSWKEFVERYSDHLLVVADVLVGFDDD